MAVIQRFEFNNAGTSAAWQTFSPDAGAGSVSKVSGADTVVQGSGVGYAQAPADYTFSHYTTSGVTTADGSVKTRITMGNSTDMVQLRWRVQGSGACYMSRIEAGQTRVWYSADGSSFGSALVDVGVGLLFTGDASYQTVQVDFTGSAFTIKRDGTTIASGSDATLTAAGGAAWEFRAVADVRIDYAEFADAAAGDTTPPTISGSITVGTVTTTSIQMSWPAGADNTAVTSYEVSSNGGGAWSDVGLVLTHTFTGLTAATSYGLRVRPKDAAGNVAVTPLSATQSTASSADTTVPTQSGSITVGTVTSTSIQFSWPAGADNVAVTAYEVSSNGGGAYTVLGNVLTHTFTGLTPSTSYGLRVRAKDAAGNVSTPALAATQSTSAAAPGSGTLTSGVLKRNNGTPAGAVSLTWLTLLNHSTGAFVATKTGVSTNSSSIFTTTDAGMTVGVVYRAVWLEATGQSGHGWVAAT